MKTVIRSSNFVALWLLSLFTLIVTPLWASDQVIGDPVAEDRSLIHSIPDEVRNEWVATTYQDYLREGKSPKNWFQSHSGGLWFGFMPKQNLETLSDYEGTKGIYKNSYYRKASWEKRFPILFVANPKPGARWYVRGPKGNKIWHEWLETNKDRPNEFSAAFASSLQFEGVPYHSEFYREFHLLGYLSMYPVVVNPDLLDETKLFVPEGNINEALTIYSKIERGSLIVQTQIITQNLVVRPILATDKNTFLRLYSDGDLLKKANATVSSPKFIESLFEQTLDEMTKYAETKDLNSIYSLGYAIVEKSTGRVIGFTTLSRKSKILGAYFEAGTLFDSEKLGQGFGTEANGSLMSHLLREPGLPGVLWKVSEGNIPSQRLAEKMGFSLVRSVAGSNVIDKNEKWLEYRKANLSFPKIDPQIHQKIVFAQNSLLALERAFLNPHIPSPAKFSLYYKILLSDPQVLEVAGPEYLSILAEDLALQPQQTLAETIRATLSNLRNQEFHSQRSCKEALQRKETPSHEPKT